MNKIKSKYHITTFIFGLLFLVSIYTWELLINYLWVFALVPAFIFGITFSIFFILSIRSNNKRGKQIGIVTSLLFIGLLFFQSDLLKSKKVLIATLWDDLSSIELILRENKDFELISNVFMFEEKFTGKYENKGNKIIFLDRPYDNDLIPDTVTILENKIILQFDSNGQANLGFAQYLEITLNELNAP